MVQRFTCGRKVDFDFEYNDYDINSNDDNYSESYLNGANIDCKDIGEESLYLPNGILDTDSDDGNYPESYLNGANIGCKDIGEDSLYLPNGLQYLHWVGYPFTCFPKNFKANNLVGLEMHSSNIIDQLWEGGERKVPNKLRCIDLCYCKLRSLDIALLLNLERLNIEVCDNLVELDMGGEKPKLKHLSLQYTKLKTLNLNGTRYLESLYLECEDLVELHMPVEHLKLKLLSLYHLKKLRALNIGWAFNLNTLHINGNYDLVELHLPVGKLKHYRLYTNTYPNHEQIPNFEKCTDLLELHMPIESSELKIIYLKPTHNHEKLGLVPCKNLLELHTPIESPKLKIIYMCCHGILSDIDLNLNLNLKLTRNLDQLDLLQSEQLLELHMPIEIPELKIIYIRCRKLATLNLIRAWNLERLELIHCWDLQELHMPIETPKLQIINILDSRLGTFNLTGVQNLERLDLVECEDLRELRMPIESPKLKIIYFQCSRLRTLDLTGAGNLERLDLVHCQDLLEILMPIESPKLLIINFHDSKLATLNLTGAPNLERLDLVQCWDLLELRMPIETPKLQIINILDSTLGILNLTGARNIEMLDLARWDLLELRMPNETPKLKFIDIYSHELRTLYLGLSPCLDSFKLHRCFNLVEIHAPIGCGCVRFKPLLIDHKIPVDFLAELHLIVSPFDICPLHPDNNLPKFHFACNYKESLPLISENLVKLISFSPCACTNLAGLSDRSCSLQRLEKLTLKGSIREVPKELYQLECLEELTLLKTDIEHLPDSIFMLKHLKFLWVESCQFLKQLPENLDRLECLEELHLEGL